MPMAITSFSTSVSKVVFPPPKTTDHAVKHGMIVNSGQTEDIRRTLERFLGHIPTLSKQKFSSNVIELVSFIRRNQKPFWQLDVRLTKYRPSPKPERLRNKQ